LHTDLEWSISKCPGDFETYKKENSSQSYLVGKGKGGVDQWTFPCGSVGGLGVTHLLFGPGSKDQCPTTADSTWYANVRVVKGCTESCSFGYSVLSDPRR
jgi:hypothetical protein